MSSEGKDSLTSIPINDEDNSALIVTNLSKYWDSQAGRVIGVKDITFSVRKGEFVSIVGPSGSGKSTLLNMLGALERPTNGQVLINGINIFSLNDSEAATMRNKRIGFIFQSYNLINRTTVLKNVEFPAIIGGMSKTERRLRAIRLLSFLGLKSKIQF